MAGTAAIGADGSTVPPGDVYRQSLRCLDIAEQALIEAGGSLADVIRTRVMLIDIEQWRQVARAHAERFAVVRPACTFVEVSRFVDHNGWWSSRSTQSSGSSWVQLDVEDSPACGVTHPD